MNVEDLFTLFIFIVAGLSLLGRRKRRSLQRGPAPDLEVDDEFAEELREDQEEIPAPGSLGELFRQIQGEQQRRAGLEPRRSVPLPSAEEVEERETLEVVPVARSREPTVRPPPVVVDRFAAAQATIQRRLREAAARSRAHTAADHRTFDKRIRAPVPTTSRTGHERRSTIQQAIVWKEILDSPVSMRDGGPLDY